MHRLIRPRMRKRRYPSISKALHVKLVRIIPSTHFGLDYHPCIATLKDGRKIDYVYVVEQESYIRVWGVYPEDDPGKASVPVNEVADLSESPSRLPAALANKLYEAGESGMGYYIFTVVFADGLECAYTSESAVDFILIPEGYTNHDITDVLPHKGRGSPGMQGTPDYYWCIYSGIDES